ncbi:hypothetical protein [Micromonospora sp. NPDC023633]|uniref:hypothetical protein n=1 Tax=Micromonospora sp. NPDC023633 TaxID=3154320 RepID=UPI0034089E12
MTDYAEQVGGREQVEYAQPGPCRRGPVGIVSVARRVDPPGDTPRPDAENNDPPSGEGRRELVREADGKRRFDDQYWWCEDTEWLVVMALPLVLWRRWRRVANGGVQYGERVVDGGCHVKARQVSPWQIDGAEQHAQGRTGDDQRRQAWRMTQTGQQDGDQDPPTSGEGTGHSQTRRSNSRNP